MSTDKDKKSGVDEISILQLADSFFPTGMYTTSSGLEALFYGKKIKGIDMLKDLIKVYLEHQMGPADCTALGVSFQCIEEIDLQKLIEVDQTIFSMKLVEEIRNASTRSGTQMLRCLSSFITDDKMLNEYQKAIKNGYASGVYPVALAVASSALGIPRRRAGIMMLYSFSVSLVGAALRLGILQHFDGQRIIHELKPVILEAVERNIERPLASMWQFAPGIDIVQVEHERMGAKMFIT